MAAMKGIRVLVKLKSMIRTCITSPHYLVSINGEFHRFFKPTRGMHQGDPLSPYLFMVAIEGLNGILENAVYN